MSRRADLHPHAEMPGCALLDPREHRRQAARDCARSRVRGYRSPIDEHRATRKEAA